MASLDSPVISPDRDTFITFGCIDGLGVVHILSYTDNLPAGETEYAFGLFGVGATGPDDVVSHTDLANVGEVAGVKGGEKMYRVGGSTGVFGLS